MLYGAARAIPAEEVFPDVRLHAPNHPAAWTIFAVLLRAQLPALEDSGPLECSLTGSLTLRRDGGCRHLGAAAGGIYVGSSTSSSRGADPRAGAAADGGRRPAVSS